ncbi:MAG: NAD(P)/FAD-dependent oxidoreductase [Candidatus Zixiibacteriota bacterium]
MNLPRTADIAIIGAGAAGLAAAISAGEAAGRDVSIVLLESAQRPGAKILVSGGGRCNVTNQHVTPDDFYGGPRPTIRKVLGAFDDKQTIAWFTSLGVPLKLESSGKYFPSSNRARDVLDALLHRVHQIGIPLVPGTPVTDIRLSPDGFELRMVRSPTAPSPVHGAMCARRLIVATGGLAFPKSGSDGAGLAWMRRLGHTIIPTTPALTPLILKKSTDLGGRLSQFSGVSFDARLRLYQETQAWPRRKLAQVEGPVLLTHFGISGPATLDLSRHWLRAAHDDPAGRLRLYLGVLPLATTDAADAWLREQGTDHPRRQISTTLRDILPVRLAEAFAAEVGRETPLSQLDRKARRRLAETLTMLELPVVGTRGYTHAEATAGGIDLREIDARTMESRLVPGLYLCGEILDVDGRIGGFNFQWAWSSGHVAGRGAVASL